LVLVFFWATLYKDTGRQRGVSKGASEYLDMPPVKTLEKKTSRQLYVHNDVTEHTCSAHWCQRFSEQLAFRRKVSLNLLALHSDDVATQWRLLAYISEHVQVSGTTEADVICCLCVCHSVEGEVCSKWNTWMDLFPNIFI